jgi:hypothetical protein
VSDTRTPEAPQPPDLRRRTLTPFGYAVVALVPVLIAVIGITILHFNYDPEDVVSGKRVPILTSTWKPGDAHDNALISGELTLGDDGCVHLTGADGTQVEVVWPFDYEATVDNGGTSQQLKLYDTDRKIVARGGDQLRMGGGYGDVGSYAGRPCAPASGEVALVQSEVVVTGRE